MYVVANFWYEDWSERQSQTSSATFSTCCPSLQSQLCLCSFLRLLLRIGWRPIRVAYDPREPYLLAPQRKIGNQPQRDTCYIQANLVVLRDIASRVAQSTINVQRYNLAPFIQIADALVSRLGGVRRAWHVLSVLSLVLKGL